MVDEASLLSETSVLDLFFGQTRVELSNGIFFLHEDKDSQTRSIAYYRSGVSAEGTFVNDYPSGLCRLSFTERNISSEVNVVNGCRTGESTYEYGNGLSVKCTITDPAPILWKPTIPYMRNYYNPSALGFGGDQFRISSASWKRVHVVGSSATSLYWLLTHFDVAQRYLRIDLTGDSLRNPPANLTEWVTNPEFSCLESATLCAQQLIRRNALNFMLPTLANLSDLNLYLPQTANQLLQSSSGPVSRQFVQNALVAFRILAESPHLRSLRLVAVPQETIELGKRSDAEGFTVNLDLLNRLEELIIESDYQNYMLCRVLYR